MFTLVAMATDNRIWLDIRFLWSAYTGNQMCILWFYLLPLVTDLVLPCAPPLKRVQHNAARLILRKRKRDHIKPLLRKLHWLPIQYRIHYKLAVLAYRHFNCTLPQYLSSKLTTYVPARDLRSASQKLLDPPTTNLKTAGDRSFASSAPSVWNSLPNSLRNISSLASFKVQLKTYFFRKALGR